MTRRLCNSAAENSRQTAAWLCATWLVCISTLGISHDTRADVRWNGSLALTSDYVQQGLSQTRGAPALQGGLRAQLDEHWTVGTWASGIDRYDGPGANIEIDVYAARAWRLTPEWIASLTATH